jgi:hypothetical protein
MRAGRAMQMPTKPASIRTGTEHICIDSGRQVSERKLTTGIGLSGKSGGSRRANIALAMASGDGDHPCPPDPSWTSGPEAKHMSRAGWVRESSREAIGDGGPQGFARRPNPWRVWPTPGKTEAATPPVWIRRSGQPRTQPSSRLPGLERRDSAASRGSSRRSLAGRCTSFVPVLGSSSGASCSKRRCASSDRWPFSVESFCCFAAETLRSLR